MIDRLRNKPGGSAIPVNVGDFTETQDAASCQQQIASQLVIISEKGIRMHPVLIRYAWPAELDAMAHAAEMKLVERWEDWAKTPFSSESGRHISVYDRR